MKEKIKELALRYEQEVISIRRYLHKHPELSFNEYGTASYVEKKLDEYGIINHKRVIETGIIAVIEGRLPGKTIGLRADIDALPITECAHHNICSQNEGVMHACGHDMHTASLLGTAFILQAIKNELKGKVILIFQPGEEYLPSGAKMLTEQQILKPYNIDWIVGQHVDPEVESGKVGFKNGAYMASTDEVFLTVKGKGGHGAFPHMTSDTILAASHIIVAMQHIVSRRKNPATPPSVLSFGRFIGDGATNIIPSKVEIAGTLRCMNEEWREEAKSLITKTAELTARTFGADCEVDIREGYPSLFNNIEKTTFATTIATKFLGNDRVVELPIRMGGEDFAYYTYSLPGTFYRFGVKEPNSNEVRGLHTPTFIADESALLTSMSTMSMIAYSFLDLS